MVKLYRRRFLSGMAIALALGVSITWSLHEMGLVTEPPEKKPLLSSGDETVYLDPIAGNDSGSGTQNDPLATIQEAVDRAPIYLRDQYTIDLATVPQTPVTYDEDVLVPAIIGTGKASREAGAERPGPYHNLVLKGLNGDPSAVKIGSILFANVVGTSAGNLSYATILRDSPYDDEQVGLSAYGTGEVHLFDIHVTGGSTNGVLAYGSKMKATRVDFGQGNVGLGLWGKRHASIIARKLRGKTNSTAFLAASNSTINVRENTTLTGTPNFETKNGGMIYDSDSEAWLGISDEGRDGPGESQQHIVSSTTTVSEHPSGASPGDIWYVDGSGQTAEGFYGLTSNGPVKLG